MGEYQKFLFDNFVLAEDTPKEQEISVPETDTALQVPEEADNTTEEVSAADIAEETVPQVEEEETAVSEKEEEVPQEEEPEVVIPEQEPVVPIIQGYTEEEVAQKVAEAEARGYHRGQEEAQRAQEQSEDTLIKEIGAKLVTLSETKQSLEEKIKEDFRQMAEVLLLKFIPLIQKGMAEQLINKFISDNFHKFVKEPKLSFYFNPEMISKAQEIIGKIAHKTDFEGKITLHKDASIAVDDCRIEWANGGVERNSQRLQNQAKELLEIKETSMEKRA